MSDPAPSPSEPTPSPNPTPVISPEEIESGKIMAILSYIPIGMVGLIVAVVVLVQKNNAFALYHAKQALTLYIWALGISLVCIPLVFLCIGAPLIIAANIAAVVFCVLGIMNANSMQCKPPEGDRLLL
jgi:uncharacterized membrane protein